MLPRLIVLSLVLLGLADSTQAALYTVGPGGTHASIQSALDTARLTMASDEIRIAQGTWNERVSASSPYPDRLDVSGGWDATFEVQTADPALTIVDGGQAGNTFSLSKLDGTLTLRNITFTGGRAPTSGSNLSVGGMSYADIEISDCVVRGGESTPYPNAIMVAPVELIISRYATLTLRDCQIHGNVVNSGSTSVGSGAINATASGDAALRLANLDIRDNHVFGGQGVGAVSVRAFERGRVEFVDNVIEGNSSAANPGEASRASAVLVDLSAALDESRFQFRRNRLLGNASAGSVASWQMRVLANTSGLVVGDSVIANSASDGGLGITLAGEGAADLVNLTLAGNGGVDLATSGGVSISNTLAGTVDASAAVAEAVASRFGGDFGFVDAAAGDFRLSASSPAVDAGVRAPAGGLGELDVAGNPRVSGDNVDQGAYELFGPKVFSDGFSAAPAASANAR